jgi:hypothetical protein
MLNCQSSVTFTSFHTLRTHKSDHRLLLFLGAFCEWSSGIKPVTMLSLLKRQWKTIGCKWVRFMLVTSVIFSVLLTFLRYNKVTFSCICHFHFFILRNWSVIVYVFGIQTIFFWHRAWILFPLSVLLRFEYCVRIAMQVLARNKVTNGKPFSVPSYTIKLSLLLLLSELSSDIVYMLEGIKTQYGAI